MIDIIPLIGVYPIMNIYWVALWHWVCHIHQSPMQLANDQLIRLRFTHSKTIYLEVQLR